VLELLPEMNDPVVVAADLGFAKKARNFAAKINAPIAFVEKRRAANEVEAEALTLIGSVEGRDVIIVDDEVDTAGSMVGAVELAKENNARNAYIVFVHPVFSSLAAERLAELPVKKIITTNTIPISPEDKRILGNKLTILSIEALLGEVILRAHEGRSVGELFHE
jgi:ribose-phosphate pyrophosphokinase